jgi:catechol 2,3-dioxygenase-like lactoylglutathione lyase family enzyme
MQIQANRFPPPNPRGSKDAKFDRTVEDLGNIVFLEHVNVTVPDQRLATLFYVQGLGLTRDPYLMTGVVNMWVNVGKSQFHLPAGNGKPQVLRGITGIVVPNRKALLERLAAVKEQLAGTKFSYRETPEYVETTCPWGNRIRVYEPNPRASDMRLGMHYVELEVPRGTADAIARFYREILGTFARVEEGSDGKAARISVGPDQSLIYRESPAADSAPAFDGHHIAIYLADFSGPYKRMLERNLISEESDQHQYRFEDITDLATGKVLFKLEHEVRSMRHPLYAREHVNRNPAQSNRVYAQGHESSAWSLPATE